MRRQDSVKAEQWHQRFKDWRNSGLSQKAYCLEHELGIHTFRYWFKRLGRAESTERSLVPVQVLPTPTSHAQPGDSGLVLQAGEFQICLQQGFDSSTLHQLLSVIRSL